MVGFLGKVIQAFKEVRGASTVPVAKGEPYAGEIITALRFSPPGEDGAPLPGDMGFFVRDNSLNGRVLVGVIDKNNEPQATAGERRLYARDQDGNIVSFVWLKSDGTLELNGNADFAVRFNELKTAFDALKTSFNNLVTNYNLHAHTGVQTGAGTSAGPNVPGFQTTADIDPAKVSEVKLP